MITFLDVEPRESYPPGVLVRYPLLMLSQGLSDTVRATILISREGTVLSYYVGMAAHPEFERSVEAGIRRMKFTPGQFDGRSVTSEVEYIFSFRCDE